MEFLLESDVIITNTNGNGRVMTADEMFVLGGEFVVYDGSMNQLYRGDSLDNAMKVLKSDKTNA